MPNSIGLREKRHYQKQTLILYVVGFSVFWIAESIIEIVLYYNCQSDKPTTGVMWLTTLFNQLRVAQCTLIFFIIFKNSSARRAFIKFVRKSLCSCHNDPESQRTISLSDSSAEGRG
jgi:hypothetical protein